MDIVLDWSPLSLAPLTMMDSLSSRGEAVAIQIEVKKGFIFSWIASLTLAMTIWILKPLSLAPLDSSPSREQKFSLCSQGQFTITELISSCFQDENA